MRTVTAFGKTGAILFGLETHADARGVFAETYRQSLYEEYGLVARFQQANFVTSDAGALRGLHYQRAPYAQAKLVHVCAGLIYDVVVDLRAGHGYRWDGVLMAPAQQLYVPEWCAHGYYALHAADVAYLCSTERVPEAEAGLRWDDPALGVTWPDGERIISERDRAWPLLERG